MRDALSILRDKIDRIDHDLLKLLAERFRLVSEVGKIKNRFGLFICVPDREEFIISCRRKEAIKLGISPDLVEKILRCIIHESYYKESEAGFKFLCPHTRPVIIIGKKDQVGKFFYRMLNLSGYKVNFSEKDDWMYEQDNFSDIGMVLINVPINMIMKVIGKLSHLPNDCIVVDLSVTKKISLQSILDVYPGPVLGLSLMFNPNCKNLIKKTVIYCKGRSPESYQWLLDQIKLWGATLYSCDSVEHDQWVSVMYGLFHTFLLVMGYYLWQEKKELKKAFYFSMPVFRLILIAMNHVFSQDIQTYLDIIMTAKNNVLLIDNCFQKFKEMFFLLEQDNNKTEFITQFNKIKFWFNTDYDFFYMKSKFILDYIDDFME